jgi:hypothetical protein
MNELQTQAELPTIEPGGNDPLMGLIERVSIDPNMDIEKLERLLDLKERYDQKEAQLAFDEAMARVQSRILPVLADADNTQTKSRYAKLTTIVSALSPIYTDEGFSVSFGTENCGSEKLTEQGWFRYTADLNHSAGFSKHYHIDLPLDTVGPQGAVNKTKIHGAKSAITYARTILMGLIFNFTTSLDVDDDGNGAGDQYITEEQLITIQEHIESIDDWNKDKNSKFLNWLNVDELEFIRSERFGAAVNFLKRKAK